MKTEDSEPTMLPLFAIEKQEERTQHLNVLPVSVIDVGAAGKLKVRGSVDHSTQSSRSGYSPFPYEVAETCAALFLRDCKVVVDPFAGWGERGAAMQRHGKKYIGFDISDQAIQHALREHGVENQLADSRTVSVPVHDGLLTCPPYWNLEQYQSKDGMDRSSTWDEFLFQYENTLSRFAASAEPGATYCIMTGDWRAKNKYYDLTFKTEQILDRLGFAPFDKVVVSRKGISKIKIMLPQAKRLGYTVKVHEMLSVFKKRAA